MKIKRTGGRCDGYGEPCYEKATVCVLDGGTLWWFCERHWALCLADREEGEKDEEGEGKQGRIATDRGSDAATVANEVTRLSSNLELAINGSRTEVAINRTDNGACFIDIEIVDGKLEIVYCDESQNDC